MKKELANTHRQISELIQKNKEIVQEYKHHENKDAMFREKYDNLHQKYHELCVEKKKHLSDLEKAYDQIEKLNAVLMGK